MLLDVSEVQVVNSWASMVMSDSSRIFHPACEDMFMGEVMTTTMLMKTAMTTTAIWMMVAVLNEMKCATAAAAAADDDEDEDA